MDNSLANQKERINGNKRQMHNDEIGNTEIKNTTKKTMKGKKGKYNKHRNVERQNYYENRQNAGNSKWNGNI